MLVLCYHAVSERWPAALSVTPEDLERQLETLVGRGYRGATFSAAVRAPDRGRTVAVTFDDGYRSVIEHAHPILSALGLPGTVFVPTSFVGQEAPMSWPGIGQWLDGPHEKEMTPMSWDELRRLADAGWEIGSHTVSHPRLTQLDDATLAWELGESRRVCELRMKRACESIAFPYGDHDGRVVQAADHAGYATAGTLPKLRIHAARELRWPRVGIYHRDAGLRFRLKVSPTVRRIRSAGAGT